MTATGGRVLALREPQPRSRDRLALVLLLAALLFGLALRWRAADHEYISQWDEAYHALVAKNLMAHPLVPTLYDDPHHDHDFRDWQANHVWLHKPPLTLWLMAGSMAVLGDSELAFRFPSILLSTLAILLTFLIARELWGRAGLWVGTLAAMLQAVNPLAIRLVSGTVPTDHVDVVTSVMAQLTIYLCLRSWRRRGVGRVVLAGAGLGLAYLAKAAAVLVILPACAILMWVRGRGIRGIRVQLARAATLLAAAVAVAGPWQIYAALRWPAEYAWESRYAWRHLFEAIESHDHAATWYLEILPPHMGGPAGIVYVAFIGGLLYAAFQAWRRRDADLLALLAWALVPYAFFSLVRTKLHAYVAPATPALLLLAAWSAHRLIASGPAVQSWARRLPAAAVGLVMLAHLVSVTVERVRADYHICPWNALYDANEFRQVTRGLRPAADPKVIFNVGDDKEIAAMFYAECSAYPEPPSVEQARDLLARGFTIYVFLDDFQTNREQIQVLHRAGLMDRIRPIMIHAPTEKVRKLPYLN